MAGKEAQDLQARLHDLEAEVANLEARIVELERGRQPAGTRTQTSPVQSPKQAALEADWPQVVPVPSRPATPLPDTEAGPRSRPPLNIELEVIIGTSWLNRIGIIAIIAAVAYFLKFSFDNQWIGPTGRVILTWLLGLTLLASGERYHRRSLAIFAQGLTGGGLAVLYFGVFAGFAIYNLIGFASAFVLMLLITVAATMLALRYDSPAIGLLGLLAGFATPLVLGDSAAGTAGPPQPVSPALYVYFLLLTAATYIVARRKQWWWFGQVGLAAGFLAPMLVGIGGTPHPSAALVYFLVLTVVTLSLSVMYRFSAAALAALLGGFVVSAIAGVGTLTQTRPSWAMAYFGIITLAAIGVAARRNWPTVALAAMVAGGVAGMLTASFSREPALARMIYLTVVAGAALAATIRRQWTRVDLVTIIVTALLAFEAVSGGRPAGSAVARIVGLTLWFAVTTIPLSLASRVHTERRVFSSLLATAGFSLGLYAVLEPLGRDALAIAALAVGTYHALLARMLRRYSVPSLTVLVHLGLALTFLTITIPLKLRQEAISLAWSVEGAALAWAAARSRNTWAGRAAAVIGALVVTRLLIVETPVIVGTRLILSAPGLAFAVGIAALVAEVVALRSLPWTSDEERYISPGLTAAAAALLLWWGSYEIVGAFARLGESVVSSGAKQATLSAWFTVYGFVAVLVGIWRNVAPVRWVGIGLLAVTVIKVLFIDLAQVAVAYRIFTLGVLGLLLLLASLAYNRYRLRLVAPPRKPEETP